MKHLAFLNTFVTAFFLFAAAAPALAQYSEMAARDNPQAQQRALFQKLEAQDARIRSLEREVYSLTQSLRKLQDTTAVFTAPAPATTPSAAATTPNPKPHVAKGAQTYTVRSGDTLNSIARRHGVSVTDLKAANRITGSDTIFLGSQIIIPAPTPAPQTAAAPKPSASPAPPAPASPAASGGYVVRTGDTLSSIARKHGTSTDALMRTNNLSNPDRLAIGQKLQIPGPSTVAAQKPAAKPAPKSQTVAKAPAKPQSKLETEFPSGYAYYTVVPGDSLYSIAKLFSTSETELRRLNKLSAGSSIQAEQQLLVPMDKYEGPYAQGPIASK